MTHDTILGRFARFAAATTLDDIPPRVIERVRLQILTSLTAAAFSRWHESAGRVRSAELRAAAKGGRSTLIAGGPRTGAEEAAVINSAYAMSLDFDDYFLMGHPGHSAVFTPLAFLEEKGGTVGELLAAVTVCNEIMGRLSLSCFFGPLNGQMWSYIHNLGAACAVAKVRGYDERTFANALAISLYQPNFCLAPGFWKEGVKTLTASVPIRTGIRAARYAGEGMEGPLDVVEGPLGFHHFFSFYPIPELAGDLGSAWLSDTLSYKRYPGTSYIAAPVDSALGALRSLGIEGPVRPADVRSVVIDATFLSYNLEKLSRSLDRERLDSILVNFSVRYSVAYALLRGDLAPKHFRESEIARHEPDIRALADRITVRHDWDMTLATLMTFPQVPAILRRMTREQRRRIVGHIRALNGGEGAGVADMLRAACAILGSRDGRKLLGRLRSRERVSLDAMDLASYRMLQSARCRIELADGASATAEFPIPTGGAGNDPGELRDLVRRRFDLAFGAPADRLLRALADPEYPVARLMRSLPRPK